MFKKFNSKTLILVFGILLALVVITQWIKKGKSDSNFDTNIVKIDTSKITTIYLKSKAIPTEVKFVKNGKSWNLVANGKSLATDQQAVIGLINELANIKAERLASSDKNDWAEYQVTDSTASVVRVEEGGKVTAKIYVGKFSYIQNPQKFSSYVRIDGEDEVYAVQGFLSMTFNRSEKEFLDKNLVIANTANITRVSFSYPGDSSFVLEKTNNSWKIGDLVPDSAKTAEFIQNLSHTTCYDVAAENTQKSEQVFAVKIEGNNMKPIEVKAFASDTITKYLVISDQNPGTGFSGSKGDILKSLFPGKNHFFATKKK